MKIQQKTNVAAILQAHWESSLMVAIFHYRLLVAQKALQMLS